MGEQLTSPLANTASPMLVALRLLIFRQTLVGVQFSHFTALADTTSYHSPKRLFCGSSGKQVYG
jgi:hypothetical protein